MFDFDQEIESMRKEMAEQQEAERKKQSELNSIANTLYDGATNFSNKYGKDYEIFANGHDVHIADKGGRSMIIHILSAKMMQITTNGQRGAQTYDAKQIMRHIINW